MLSARSFREVQVLTFEEAAELSTFGSKVVHPAAVLPAWSAGVPMSIKNSMAPELPGTAGPGEIQVHMFTGVDSGQKSIQQADAACDSVGSIVNAGCQQPKLCECKRPFWHHHKGNFSKLSECRRHCRFCLLLLRLLLLSLLLLVVVAVLLLVVMVVCGGSQC